MRLLSKQQQRNLFFLLLLLLMPSAAFAGFFLDNIDNDFKEAILGLGGEPGWQTIITAVAKSLFWKLVLLDFTWTTIVWVKDRKEIGEILSGYVGKIFTIGFFWLLLQMAGTWIPAIIDLFAQTGRDVATANKAQVGTLDGVFTQGLDLAGAIAETLSGLDVFERIFLIFPAAFGAFCAAIGFALIAGQLLVTLIESYIAIGAGIIMLGFGGSRWTSDMATAYLKFAIGTGMKLMLCYLIIGLGFGLFNGAIPTGDDLSDPGDYLAYIFRLSALVLIYVYLVFNIPGLASAIMSGSPNMSLGGMMGAAITAGAAAASGGAAAAATTGKAAALGGAAAAEGGGIAKAVGEGFKANKAAGMTNMGAAAAAVVPGIKSAAGMVGAKAVEAGKGLAEGGKGALGKAGDAINNSVGGKVAADIAEKSGAKTASGGSTAPTAGDATSSAPAAAPVDTTSSAPASTDTTSSTPSPASNFPAPGKMVGDVGGGGAPTSSLPEGGPSSPSTSAKPAENKANPTSGDNSSQLNDTAPGGDASGAKVGSSDPHTRLLEAINANMEKMAGAGGKPKLHEKISGLQKYVPQDGATVAAAPISMGHTRD